MSFAGLMNGPRAAMVYVVDEHVPMVIKQEGMLLGTDGEPTGYMVRSGDLICCDAQGHVTLNGECIDAWALVMGAAGLLRLIGAPEHVLDQPRSDPVRQKWEALAVLSRGEPMPPVMARIVIREET